MLLLGVLAFSSAIQFLHLVDASAGQDSHDDVHDRMVVVAMDRSRIATLLLGELYLTRTGSGSSTVGIGMIPRSCSPLI